MKNLRYLLISCITFIFHSCGTAEWETTLYAQKIEGTSKILYKYDAWGGRDSHEEGYAVLDSTEKFEVNQINKLPISYLEEIPNRSCVLGVEFEEPKEVKKELFTPIKNSKLNEQNIEIKTKVYQYNGFMSRSFGYDEYEFESYKETRDSLFFYDLDDVKSAEPKHLKILKFRKRNIIIRQKNNMVVAINIEDLIISSKNNEVISNVTYSLTPKKKLRSNEFTDYGVFKEKM